MSSRQGSRRSAHLLLGLLCLISWPFDMMAQESEAPGAGIVHHPQNPGVAPLQIVTRSGALYYVKLVDGRGLEVMSMLVVGGQTFETRVPLGTYELRYCAGETWHGIPHLFGNDPPPSCAKAEDQFEFKINGSQVTGFSVELILQQNGNLQTTTINPDEF